MSCDVGEVTERLENERSSSPTFPLLYLRHSSFSNPSVALCTSQLILQPFRTYIKAHSPTLPSILLRHRLFTYVTQRAAHEYYVKLQCTSTQKMIHNINYVCKIICPEAGLSLDMHYRDSTSVYWTKERSEVVCPFLTEPVALQEYLPSHTDTGVLQIQLLRIPYLEQLPNCHSHNGTEPSWERQILL